MSKFYPEAVSSLFSRLFHRDFYLLTQQKHLLKLLFRSFRYRISIFSGVSCLSVIGKFSAPGLHSDCSFHTLVTLAPPQKDDKSSAGRKGDFPFLASSLFSPRSHLSISCVGGAEASANLHQVFFFLVKSSR